MILKLPLLLAFASAAHSKQWSRTRCGWSNGDGLNTTSLGPLADIPTSWGIRINASSRPLSEWPRPQLVRTHAGGSSKNLKQLRDEGTPGLWSSLNGLWEWEPALETQKIPPFGRNLNKTIMVPFPVESCLSGVAGTSSFTDTKRMWYRLVFNSNITQNGNLGARRWLLHFGAVDWQASVYLNGKFLGNHTGGYDGFSFDITHVLKVCWPAKGNKRKRNKKPMTRSI